MTTEIDPTTIPTLPPPALRRLVREVLKVDPLSINNGDTESLRTALIDHLTPKAAAPAKNKGGRPKGSTNKPKETTPAPEATGDAEEPSEPANDDAAVVATPGNLDEWQRTIEMRLATLEQWAGIAAGVKPAAPASPSPDKFSQLSKFMEIGPDKEPQLRMEAADIDELNEVQLRQLAELLTETIDPGMPVRIIKVRLKKALAAVLGDAPEEAAAPAAKPGKAAAKFTPKPKDLVVALDNDGETHDPAYVIMAHAGKWLVHFPDDSINLVPIASITAASKAKKWDHETYDPEDFDADYLADLG